MVDPAIETGEYRRCFTDEIPPHVTQFTRRVGNAAEDGTAFIRRNGRFYALYVQFEDKLYSNP
jgi:hypothetical protein